MDAETVMRAARQPTRAEMDAHGKTHIPHQSWCSSCRRGHARETAHKAGAGEHEVGRELHLDFAFSDKDTGTFLIARERVSRATAALAVMHKGELGRLAAERLNEILECIGLSSGRLVIKCDQEGSAVAVARELANVRGGPTHRARELTGGGERCQWDGRAFHPDRVRPSTGDVCGAGVATGSCRPDGGRHPRVARGVRRAPVHSPSPRRRWALGIAKMQGQGRAGTSSRVRLPGVVDAAPQADEQIGGESQTGICLGHAAAFE